MGQNDLPVTTSHPTFRTRTENSDSVDWTSILHRLDSKDPKIIIEAAFELANAGRLEAVPRLLELFHGRDPSTMNALAYALGELKVQEAKPAIIELMRDPGTRGSRGSLMYALMSLDCNDDFDDMLEFICNDVWEVRHKALIILDEIAPSQGAVALTSGRARLVRRLEDDSIEGELRSHVADALEVLDFELRERDE